MKLLSVLRPTYHDSTMPKSIRSPVICIRIIFPRNMRPKLDHQRTPCNIIGRMSPPALQRMKLKHQSSALHGMELDMGTVPQCGAVNSCSPAADRSNG